MFPVPDDDGKTYLTPASWKHVIDAFVAMQRYGTKIRPCPLTASSVFLDARSKMSVSAMHAVFSFQTVNFMRDLWAYDQTLPEDSAGRTFSSNPEGTIAYLEFFAELVTIVHHCRGRYKYKSEKDSRLQRAQEMLKEMRIVTQQITALWATKAAWLVSDVKYARQCFVTAEGLSSLDNTVSSFASVYLPQVLRLCPKLRSEGVSWTTTGSVTVVPPPLALTNLNSEGCGCLQTISRWRSHAYVRTRTTECQQVRQHNACTPRRSGPHNANRIRATSLNMPSQGISSTPMLGATTTGSCANNK